MELEYCIKEEVSGEVVVKKSRFIASLAYVDSEAEAETFIKNKKKQYHDARHNCSCYIIGKDGANYKSSDDGEPSGTAGRPMLEVIEGAKIYNVVAVVTRYFGGVLLGTGGLVRAYQDAIKVALDNAVLSRMITVQEIELSIDYNNWTKTERFCRDNKLEIADTSFLENVKAIIRIPIDDTDSIVEAITEMVSGKCEINKLEVKEVVSSL